MAIAVVVVWPAVIDAVAGVAAMATEPTEAAVTESEIVVVTSATPTPRARIVMEFAGGDKAVEPATAKDTVLAVAPLLSVAGENVAVTPDGRVSAVRTTSPVKFVRPTVIVELPVAFWATESVGEPALTAMLAVPVGGLVTSFLPLHAVHTRTLAASTSRENLLFICKGAAH
jgi:hypothetical protein